MSIEFLATSIADRAYDSIRADIVFGRLVPGARLRLDRLAGEYGASVSTLRRSCTGSPRRASCSPRGSAASG
jgi:DNA-binding FadR family transcriptional regulator